jgi:HD-GYP domain-containing protein (c-di-GMP phosphodiesterase class II)
MNENGRAPTGAGKLEPHDQRVHLLQLLVETGTAISERDDFEEVLGMVAETALRLGSCEGVSLYEVVGNHLRFIKSRNLVFESRPMRSSFKEILLPIDEKTMAGYTAWSKKIVNIDDVYHLPSDSLFTYNPGFDTMMNYRSKSMLAIPMLDTKGNCLGVLQLINRNVDGELVSFPKDLEPVLKALASHFGVVLRNLRVSQALKQSRIETVKKFVKASEYHDTDTGGHIERMSRYSVLLYKALGKSEQECDIMALASMLHDIGKIATPDAVLKKPGKLTPEEWEIMRRHTVNGYEMLAGAESPFLQVGSIIAYTHHEKWDGSGYPRALKSHQIPIEGRVVALADVYDALCSRRCYKESWPMEKVLETIKESSGSHFDPDLVNLFLDNFDKIQEIQNRFPIEPPPVVEGLPIAS